MNQTLPPADPKSEPKKPKRGQIYFLGQRENRSIPFWGIWGLVLAVCAGAVDAAGLARVELLGFQDRLEAQQTVGALS